MDKIHNAKHRPKSGLSEGTTYCKPIPGTPAAMKAKGKAQIPAPNPSQKDGPFTVR